MDTKHLGVSCDVSVLAMILSGFICVTSWGLSGLGLFHYIPLMLDQIRIWGASWLLRYLKKFSVKLFDPFCKVFFSSLADDAVCVSVVLQSFMVNHFVVFLNQKSAKTLYLVG